MQLKKENLKSVFWVPKPGYQSIKWPEYVTAVTVCSLLFM